jgi:hypothetical protein
MHWRIATLPRCMRSPKVRKGITRLRDRISLLLDVSSTWTNGMLNMLVYGAVIALFLASNGLRADPLTQTPSTTQKIGAWEVSSEKTKCEASTALTIGGVQQSAIIIWHRASTSSGAKVEI